MEPHNTFSLRMKGIPSSTYLNPCQFGDSPLVIKLLHIPTLVHTHPSGNWGKSFVGAGLTPARLFLVRATARVAPTFFFILSSKTDAGSIFPIFSFRHSPVNFPSKACFKTA